MEISTSCYNDNAVGGAKVPLKRPPELQAVSCIAQNDMWQIIKPTDNPENEERIKQLLADFWEPFAVVAPWGSGAYNQIYFRRKRV
jgi:hypothetical protein